MSPRGDNDPDRDRRERNARRAARADWATAAERSHTRERADAALARSQARRSPRAVGQPQNGSGGAYPPRRRRRRFFVPVLLLLTLIALVAGWFLISLYQPGKQNGTGR